MRVSARLPAAALAGDSVVIVGTGLLASIVKDKIPDVPPPGAGLTTVILALPVLLRSETGTEAVSFVLLT